LPLFEDGWSGSDIGRFFLRKIDRRAKFSMWLSGPPYHSGHIEKKATSCLFQELNHDFSVVQPILQTSYWM